MRWWHALLLGCGLSLSAQAACPWPQWQQFKHDYMTAAGRIVDPSSPNAITTSEGQSYALFFALVADDRPTFDRLLDWTQDRLAQGDLTGFLPAWQWGQDAQGQWRVLDENNASDADLWIAYSLLAAGEHWHSHRYASLGDLLLRRVAREAVVTLPGLGPVLLPGRVGFGGGDRWRFNPSYLPPQLLARFARQGAPWARMRAANLALLTAGPHGWAPDWLTWQAGQWLPDADQGSLGSYDAIRVYLWTGMLSPADPSYGPLQQHLKPVVAQIVQRGQVPERVDTQTGQLQGEGPVGFAAALLPLLHDTPAAAPLRQRLAAHYPGNDAYYDSVLSLFGLGWDQGRYRFGPQGELQLTEGTCPAHP